MSKQQCRKMSDELCRDSETQNQDPFFSWGGGGGGGLQYVCDNTFVYNAYFVQKPN
jgi:hypothetical protein